MAQKKSKQKMSAKQREDRIKAAEERQRKEKAARERKERWKRIGVVAVCVILVLALGLPITQMTLCSQPDVTVEAPEI